MALNSGKKFLNQECHRAAGISPFQEPPHIQPSRTDQRAPLRQGALGEGHSGLWQRSDARGRPAPLRLRTGTGWPAGGPALSRLPVAFLPFVAGSHLSRWCRVERGPREAALLCLGRGGAELGFCRYCVLRGTPFFPEQQRNRQELKSAP